MLAGPARDPHKDDGKDSAGKQRSIPPTNTACSSDPNYLTFAANRPRAPLLVPAALRREGATVSKARAGSNSGSSRRSASPASHSLAPHRGSGKKNEHSLARSASNHLNSNDEHLLTSSTSSPNQPTAGPLPQSPTVPTISKWLQGHTAGSTSTVPNQACLEEPVHSPIPANDSLQLARETQAVGQMLLRSKWTPDNQVQVCQYSACSAVFPPIQGKALDSNTTFFGGFTNILAHPFHSRRHHCRACGKIFCSGHSSHTLPLFSHDPPAKGYLSPSPVTPGFASPIAGAFPFSLRRSSSSGVATPSGSPDQYEQWSKSASSPFALEIVQARVCDDCFTSLQLASSLAELVSLPAGTPPSLSHSAASTDQFDFRSQTPTSTQTFSRPESAMTACQKVQEHRYRNRGPSGNDVPERDNSAANKCRLGRRDIDAHQEPPTAAKARSMHPLDPRHSRLEGLASEEGVNPSSPLAASLGTTPGIGWTWSTF